MYEDLEINGHFGTSENLKDADESNKAYYRWLFNENGPDTMPGNKSYKFPKIEKPSLSKKRLSPLKEIGDDIRELVGRMKSSVDSQRTLVAERVFDCCLSDNPKNKKIYFGSDPNRQYRVGVVYDELGSIFAKDPQTYLELSEILDGISYKLYVARFYAEARFDGFQGLKIFYDRNRAMSEMSPPIYFFYRWLRTCQTTDNFIYILSLMVKDNVETTPHLLKILLKSEVPEKNYFKLLKPIEELMEDRDAWRVLHGFYKALCGYCGVSEK